MTYGFIKVGKGIREQKYWEIPLLGGVPAPLATRKMLTVWTHSELAREKMWSRIYLIPLLQAEEDRDLVRKHLADRAREKELLGIETSPYNSNRYVNFATRSLSRVRSESHKR